MAYGNFKEERHAAKEQLMKRRENNKKLFDELIQKKELPKCYNPDKEYSYKEFNEKHFGIGRIQEEEEFQEISNIDIVCTVFDNCTFGNIKFKDCTFIGCKFNNCNFESGGVIFQNCSFYKEESEKKPSLNRRDNFSCEFNKCKIYAKFESCILSYVIFSDTLLHNVFFMLSDMTSIIIINSELNRIRIEDCDLSGAKIINTYIIDLDFTDKIKTKLDEKTFFDKIQFREKNRAEYEGIYMTYETIADKFKNNSLNNNFGEYYYLCKVTQRKALNFLPRVYSYIYWASCGYGERPVNAIVFDLVLIVLFAILFVLIGIKIDGRTVSYIYEGINGKNLVDYTIDMKEALTYSIDLFTGIGGADGIEPVNFTLTLTNIEKIVGFICMGIGVGTITRKLVR